MGGFYHDGGDGNGDNDVFFAGAGPIDGNNIDIDDSPTNTARLFNLGDGTENDFSDDHHGYNIREGNYDGDAGVGNSFHPDSHLIHQASLGS